jgi:signal transduction histidine kinase
MTAEHRYALRSSAAVRLWAPVFLSLIVQIPPVFFDYGTNHSIVAFTSESNSEIAFALALAMIGPVALIGARRFPGPVVAIVAVAASADLLLADGVDGPPYMAFAFAIGAAIVRGARVWAWASIALSWSGSLALAAFFGLQWQPWRIAGITVVILIIVGLAEGLRTKREHSLEVFREFVARQQAVVQAERVRIARELHDVLAHSLSQINVQAGVGLHLMEKDPQKAADALSNIKESSKTALDEVRSVLGALRAEGTLGEGAESAPLVPEPDLARLPALTSPLLLHGVEVQLDDELSASVSAGEPRDHIPQGIQLAMYRIVQESLTNVSRHSGATTVSVSLSRSEGSYVVRITDNGTGANRTSDKGGRGVLGMRERAELLGGTLSAGRTALGGFEVLARIPERQGTS